MFVSLKAMFIHVHRFNLPNRQENGRRQKMIKVFKVKWIAELSWSWLQAVFSYQMNSAPYCFLRATSSLTMILFFTIICCSSVVYHNFVSCTISCSKVSCKILWSTVNVRLCITSVKSAAISSLPAFSWLLITSCLVKQLKLRASLKSGILSAYSIGLINELEK